MNATSKFGWCLPRGTTAAGAGTARSGSRARSVPSRPSGEYTLRLPADEAEAALGSLRAAPLVLDAYTLSEHP